MITNPLTVVKQIKLQELSLGDIYSFCLYFFHMNDCIDPQYVQTHVIAYVLYDNNNINSKCGLGKMWM